MDNRREQGCSSLQRGLTTTGVIMVNGKEAGEFGKTFIPYTFKITLFLKGKDNTLAIVFKCPPSYLGQIGYTSKIRDWKPRFYYGWDWIPRIVQIGIWDDISLEIQGKNYASIENLRMFASAGRTEDTGQLAVSAELTPQSFYGKSQDTIKKAAQGN